jgi:hypothetical protein
MNPITYQQYLDSPALREQLERAARDARSQAVHAFIGSLFARFVRPARRPVATMRMTSRHVPA